MSFLLRILLIKGEPGDPGVTISATDVPGVPARTYFVLEKTLPNQNNPKDFAWPNQNYGGNAFYAFFQVDPTFIVNNVPDKDPVDIYLAYQYTLLGDTKVTTKVTAANYVIDDSPKWDFKTRMNISTGGSPLMMSDTIPRVRSPGISTGWGYFHETSQANVGNLVIKTVAWRLFQSAEGKIPWDFAVNQVPAKKEGITLYAQWYGDPSMSFDVFFHAMGGEPTPPKQSGPAGSFIGRPLIPNKKNRDFDGWFKTDDIDPEKRWNFAVDTIPAEIDGITLYAGWRINGDGGTSTPDPNPVIKIPGGTGGTGGSGGDDFDDKTAEWLGAGDELTKEAIFFWQETNKLEETLNATNQSWKITHTNPKSPMMMDSTARMTYAVPGKFLLMPSYVLDTLHGHTNRNLQVDLGAYQWFFNSDSYWMDSTVKNIPIAVADSTFAPIRSLLGSGVNAHQFKLAYGGSWHTKAVLAMEIADPNLAGKTLYLYRYNTTSGSLEYVSQMQQLESGWYSSALPETALTPSYEYVATDQLYTDAKAIAQTNPETGGVLLVADLIQRGEIVPAADLVVRTQNVSSFSPLMILLPTALAAGTAMIFLLSRKKADEEETEVTESE